MFMPRFRSILALLFLLALLLGCSSALPPVAEEEPLLTVERVLRYEHRLVNSSSAPATLEMFLAVPRSNERQAVRCFAADCGYVGLIEDEYGNRILHYIDEAVPAGDVIAHGWIAEVAVSNYVGRAGVAGMAVTLDAAERELYLRDCENYGVGTRTIQDLAADLCTGRDGDEQKLRSIFRYLIEHLTYLRDDVWDPAPQVIERGSGSCSEFNYALIALCRAAGIPTRWTGGMTLTSGRETSYAPEITEDAVFHRWTEVFLEGRGWFPVDCCRAGSEVGRLGNPENYYGRLPAGLLQCVRGDGAGSSPLGWDYISSYQAPYETRDWSGQVAFWIDDVPAGALGPRVDLVRRRLEAGQSRALFTELLGDPLDREILFLHRNLIGADSLPDLVAALLEARHPEAIYWSLLAGHRGIELPGELRFPEFCDVYLLEQIDDYYRPVADAPDLFTFEYWWRKARPKTCWDEERDVFVLTSRSINIY